MKRSLLLALALAVLAPASPGYHGRFGGLSTGQATMCLARIDDRGIVHVRHLTGVRAPAQEIVIKKRNDKGQLEDVKVVVQREFFEEQVTTLHVSGVQLFDTAGQPQDAKKLATLLKQERPVLVFQGKPAMKYLAGYKKDLPVLALPRIEHGGTGEPIPPPSPPKKMPGGDSSPAS